MQPAAKEVVQKTRLAQLQNPLVPGLCGDAMGEEWLATFQTLVLLINLSAIYLFFRSKGIVVRGLHSRALHTKLPW